MPDEEYILETRREDTREKLTRVSGNQGARFLHKATRSQRQSLGEA